MENYDLVVIGSGIGLNLINVGLELGLKCAIIEDSKMGGTCLTRGCIPSKVLVHPADLIREAEHAKKIGIQFNIEEINWDLMAKRMWSQIDHNKGMEVGLSNAPGLTLYKGIGQFTGEYEMTVKSKENGEILGHFKGARFVIASGARSFIPPIKGIEEVDYVTSETFFGEKFPNKPWNSLIVIGGGVIAAEFAHIFSAVGTDVTIVEMLPRLVATEEPEISDILEKSFSRQMTVFTNYKAVEARLEGDLKVVSIQNTQTGEKKEVKAEEILVATGRISNADILQVEKTGIEIDRRGWIKTNDFLETSKQNVWCLGDANGKYQFRHKANYEGRICSRNIFGRKEDRMAVDYSSVPWAIFTYPQIGHVGMTEAEAIDKGHEIFVAINRYSSVAKGFAMGFEEGDEDDGLVKLVIDKSYRILGAHIIGPNAAVLVQPFVFLMNSGFTCQLSEVSDPNLSPKLVKACPEAGSFMPIYESMIIHPSLNEVTGWAIGNMKPVNIKQQGHKHGH